MRYKQLKYKQESNKQVSKKGVRYKQLSEKQASRKLVTFKEMIKKRTKELGANRKQAMEYKQASGIKK